MINRATAVKIANDYFAQRGGLIPKRMYETEEAMIVYASKGANSTYASAGIAINKTTGEVEDVSLRTSDNLDLLKNAKMVSLK